jgi:hypothetical protein
VQNIQHEASVVRRVWVVHPDRFLVLPSHLSGEHPSFTEGSNPSSTNVKGGTLEHPAGIATLRLLGKLLVRLSRSFGHVRTISIPLPGYPIDEGWIDFGISRLWRGPI